MSEAESGDRPRTDVSQGVDAMWHVGWSTEPGTGSGPGNPNGSVTGTGTGNRSGAADSLRFVTGPECGTRDPPESVTGTEDLELGLDQKQRQ